MSRRGGMRTPADTERLESAIGYTFNDKNLLLCALTHSSYSNEKKSTMPWRNNERFEFLGDSVLSLVVSEYLMRCYDTMQEGELTRLRASLVCEEALSRYARKLGLGEYLLLGHGEDKNNVRNRASILSDAFEAVISAIYIDDENNGGDGKSAVARFVLPYVEAELKEKSDAIDYFDYKTMLQQIIQQAEGERLEYVVIAESGPDHDKTFEVEARMNSNVIGRGVGRTKRAAEQAAAAEAVKLFGVGTE